MSLADMGTATRGGGVAVIDHSSGGGTGGGAGGGLPGAGRMTHSLSTPSGVDGTPSTPRHRGGKKLTVRIQMLDDTVTMFQVQVNSFSMHMCITNYYSLGRILRLMPSNLPNLIDRLSLIVNHGES